MKSFSWLKCLSGRVTGRAARRPIRHASRLPCRLCLEALEDRSLPSFLAPVNYPVDPGPQAVATADFNGDGRLDLAVSNGPVGVLLGNGDGTFQAARNVIPTGISNATPGTLAVGDFNADGRLDLATANYGGEVIVALGNGDGTFAPARSLVVAPNSNALSVAVGDLNGDGKLDLAVGAEVPLGYPDYGPYLHVLLGNGDGTFAVPRTYALPQGVTNDRFPYSVQVGDLNGDGKLDVVTANFELGGATVSVLLGNGDGTLQPPTTFDTGPGPLSVAVADLNGDGKLDLATANYNSTTVSVLLNNGTGAFPTFQNFAAGANPASVAVADVNGDGRRDLITANYGSDNVSVLLGNGNGTFQVAQNSAAGSFPIAVAAGNFNGDLFPDLVVANERSNNVSVLINAAGVPAPLPALAITDVTVTEGNVGTASAVFTVSLSAASSQPVTINFTTANGTAIAGSDYQAASGTLTFAPGQLSQTSTVLVLGDRLPEPNETFVVNLSGATNATITDGQGVGTILDNEPRISISDVAMKEGKTGQTTLFTFTVTLSAAYDQAVTMSFRTVDGTAKTSDSDYTAKTGTLTFAPGETTKTITIVVNGDSKKEANETFYLDLFGNSSNSLFTKNRGVGTILNDD